MGEQDRDQKHIPLERTFHELSRYASESDDVDLSNVFHVRDNVSWDELLTKYRVVILSEAGSGKTEEIRQKAIELRAAGKDAFFLRLENVASHFDEAFEPGTGSKEELETWLGSDREGFIFLDSVDEARLRNPGDFDLAIRTLGNRLKDSLERAHIFITGRSSAWRPKSDLTRCMLHLSMPARARAPAGAQASPEPADKIFENSEAVEEDEDEEDESGGSDGPTGESAATGSVTTETAEPKSEPFAIVTLADLTPRQIALFAKARGVANTSELLEEIERADADSFTTRPQDLEDVIAFWKENKRIGTRLELMENSVSRRLKERDEDRSSSASLTVEDARSGARLMAAATTLTKNQSIQVPDGSDSRAGIPIGELLPSWSPKDQEALLQRPIFDQELYGAVRFHHRSVREFLTAEWIAELLRNPSPRRDVEALLFKTQYGVEMVVPTMRPILPWLAILDEKVREKVEKIAPEVLFEGGDPSRLPLSVRQRILKEVTLEIATRKRRRSPTDYEAVQRFASRELAGDIQALLREYETNGEAASFLLRMIWLGKIDELLPEAKRHALQRLGSDYQRTVALRAVRAVGSKEDQAEVLGTLIAELGPLDRDWSNELVGYLEKSSAGVDSLIKLVAISEKPAEYHVDQFSDATSNYVDEVALADLPRIVSGFVALLRQPPYVEARMCAVSVNYKWLLKIAARAVYRLVEAKDPFALHDDALSVLQMLHEIRHWEDDVKDIKSRFPPLVTPWDELNRALFWVSVRYARSLFPPTEGQIIYYWQARNFGEFWTFGPKDFDYFLGQVSERQTLDDKKVALSGAYELYVAGGRLPAWRKKLKAAAGVDPALTAMLGTLLKPPKRTDPYRQQELRFKRKRAADEKRKKLNREKSIVYLNEHVESLRSPKLANPGDITNSQWYLHNQLGNKAERSGKWSTGQWKTLIPDFGVGVARAWRDGAVSYWRSACPLLRSEGAEPNKTTFATIFGLTGLAIEARETPNWPKTLSDEEAELATRYAIHELNGVPKWFAALYEAHPIAVGRVVMNEVTYELATEPAEGSSYIINDVGLIGKFAKEDLAPKVLDLLERFEPKSASSLEQLLQLLLGSPLSSETLADLAKRKLQGPDPVHEALWFSVWVGTDPAAALEAFDARLNALQPEQARSLAMSFVTYLMGGSQRSETSISREAFRTPNFLKELYFIIHRHVRVAEDVNHTGPEAREVTPRDRAQDARNSIFEALNAITGKEAFLALQEIAKAEPSRPWIAEQALRHAEQDGDLRSWSPREVREFNERQERTPADHKDLAELALSRFIDVKLEMEGADDSVSALLAKVKVETEVRGYLYHVLRERAQGRYTVTQEEELADAKRPDIKFHGMGFDAPVPAELKLAEKWTGPQLFERLENQLSGDYLRDVRSARGLFVLVTTDPEKGWQLPSGERVNFEGLVAALQEHWKALSPDHPNVDEITVVGIDLRKRDRSPTVKKGRRHSGSASVVS